MRNLPYLLYFLSLTYTFIGCQTAVTYQNEIYEWIFTPNNENGAAGGTYMRELIGGNIRLYKGFNGVGSIKAPNSLFNGLIFEGEEIAVAAPNANFDLGTSFGMGMWIYITKITGTHTLFCRQTIPAAPDPGINLCLSFDANKFWWSVKDTSLLNVIAEAWADEDMYEDVPISDMVPQLGWQYLTFNVYSYLNVTAFGGYYTCDNLKSYNQTRIYPSVYMYTDDPANNYLMIGGMLDTATTVKNAFVGIIQHIQIYTKPLGRFQIFDQATYKCQPYCNLCKVAEMPKCIQQYEDTLLGFYDFAPPKFSYSANIPDLGPAGNNLNALTLDTQTTEPTAAAGADPVYVDRQGFFFDYTGKQLTATPDYDQISSLTIEAWVRFNNSATTGTLVNNAYVVRKGAGGSQVMLWFSNIPQLCMTVNGITHRMAISVTQYTWYFIVGSVMKINPSQSDVCVLFLNSWSCSTYNQVYTDAAANQLVIGGGFIGVINKVKIFQYPKIELEAKHNMRLASNGACLKFNGRTCLQCDIEDKSPDTDFRYVCKSDCMEHQYWTDCRECHARCRTCYEQDEYHCLSCYDRLYDFHASGTVCVEACGDGYNMGFYECDDGNIANGDGCDFWCNVEKGFKCSGGSATGRDTCTEICGDGRSVARTCAGTNCFLCDDGNTVSGDGCDSSCKVEPGFVCTGGGLSNRDVCYEECGDGLNFGGYQCDDGNTASGDGCSAACKVEQGWTCAGGSSSSPDVCVEKCGDGRSMGSFGCDDGNKVNGDGCDSNCAVEWGWDCFETSPLVPSFCYVISWPKITDWEISSDNKVLAITFNETIVIDSNWKADDWSFVIDGEIPPYNFTWSLYQSGALVTVPQQTVYVNFSINAQIYGGETLTFGFNYRNTTLSGYYKTVTLDDGFTINLNQQEDPLGGSCGIEIYQVPMFALIYADLGLALFGAFMFQSTAPMMHLLGNIQILSLAMMYNAVYPTCLIDFFKALTLIGTNFKMFGGDWVGGIVGDIYSGFMPPDYKFTRIGLTAPSVLYNSGGLIFFWMILFVIYCLVYAIEFVLQPIPYVRKVCLQYRRNFLIAAMNFTFLKMAFDSTFGMFYLNFSSGYHLLSSCAGVVMASLTLFFPAYLAYQSGTYQKELKKVGYQEDQVKNIRSEQYFVEYDSSHAACYNYMLANTIKKCIFVGLSLFMYQIKCYSLLLSAMIMFAYLMYFSYVRPFKSAMHNITIICEEFMTMMCFLVLFKFASTSTVGNILKSKSQAKLFAFFVTILTIAPAVLTLLEIVKSMRNFKSICNWKRDFQEEKEDFESSEEELNETEDLLKGQVTEDSVVEKSISISDESYDGKPRRQQKQVEPSVDEDTQRDRTDRSIEERSDNGNDTNNDQSYQNEKQEPPQQRHQDNNSFNPPASSFNEPQTRSMPQQQTQSAAPYMPTKEPKMPESKYQAPFSALDFGQAIEDANNAKERLPDLNR